MLIPPEVLDLHHLTKQLMQILTWDFSWTLDLFQDLNQFHRRRRRVYLSIVCKTSAAILSLMKEAETKTDPLMDQSVSPRQAHSCGNEAERGRQQHFCD